MAGHKVFINLMVKDLQRSIAFFSKLGFTFNPQFTDDKAASMVLSEDGYVMLLTEPFFRTFTKKEPADTSKFTEAYIAVSCESRAAVEQMVKTAVENGGSHAMPAQDHGFMFGWSFYDP